MGNNKPVCKEYKAGSYTVAASFYDSGSQVYSTEASFLTAAATKVTIKSKKYYIISVGKYVVKSNFR